MSDYYHHFLSSMSGAGGHPMTTPLTPDEMHLHPFSGNAPIAGAPMMGSYQNLGYIAGFQDPAMLNTTKTGKVRRKAGIVSPGGEHVKHRRTRSGCFMCRSRRVKCDETRPVCDRCRKGNRECVYPDPPASKSGAKDRSKATQQTSPSPSNEDDEEGDTDAKLETIKDEEELQNSPIAPSPTGSSRHGSVSFQNIRGLEERQSSETPSAEGNKSSSPSASTVTSFSTAAFQPSDFSSASSTLPDLSQAPPDVRRHLAWFVENITHYHYCLGIDYDNFFGTILVSLAVRSEPLLNALVGFSAYHSTLSNPHGEIRDFLQYYNKSVTLLLSSLQRKEKHDVATLMTILQLATIEEYLGDWVNLMGHQKAALEMITKVFSPQTVMQTPIGRMCLWWYIRFDNFVALMGGFPTELPREWFEAMISFYQNQKAAQPEVLRWKTEERLSKLRLITYDMSIVFARGSRGQLSPERFAQEHDRLTHNLVTWKESWDPALTDSDFLVTDFGGRQPDPDDIVNPYGPDIIYDAPLFNSTIISAEWHSIMIMHKSQSSTTRPDILFGELRHHAMKTCQYFEAVEYWPLTPKGALVMLQACVAISALFVPQDQRHHMWLRRKYARLETLGYIHPLSLRTKMAELFRDPACAKWWLPGDEGLSPALQNIRSFADERNAAAVTAQQESLREVRHIFAKLELYGAALMGQGQ